MRRGFNPWIGKIPGGGNDSPLQDSCLENPMDGGACRATVHTGEQRNNVVNIELRILSVDGHTEIQDMMYSSVQFSHSVVFDSTIP